MCVDKGDFDAKAHNRMCACYVFLSGTMAVFKTALRSFEWVSAWLSGIIPSGAPPPTPRRSPPRGSRERRALTPLLSPNHRLFALNHLVNLLSRHMLDLTACAIPRQLDDSIPRENYPHESAKGLMFIFSLVGSSFLPASILSKS